MYAERNLSRAVFKTLEHYMAEEILADFVNYPRKPFPISLDPRTLIVSLK